MEYSNTIRLICAGFHFPELQTNESLLCSNMEENINISLNIAKGRKEVAPDTRAGGKKIWVKDYGFMLENKILSSCCLPFNFTVVNSTQNAACNKNKWKFAAVTACAINNNVAKKVFATRKWVISPRQRRLPLHLVRKCVCLADFAVDLRGKHFNWFLAPMNHFW